MSCWRKEYGLVFYLLSVTACSGSPAARAPGRAPVPQSQPTAPGFAQCQRWGQEVEAAIRRGDGRAIDYTRRLTRAYHDLRGHEQAARAEVARCRKYVARILGDNAVRWHREGQRAMDNHALELASTFYGEYVRTFPDAADVYDMTFYHAELLFKLQRWDQAARAYARVVKLNPKGKHAGPASYAGLMACRRLVDGEEQSLARAQSGTIGRRRRDDITPKKIPGGFRRFLAAVDTHLRLVPGSAQRVALMYRQARVYYRFNHHDHAVKLFAAIATGHPDHELAVYAANLLLDSLNIQRKYAELNAWVERLLKEPKLAKGEFLVQLTKLRMGAQRKAAEELQRAGRHSACALKYIQIADTYPRDVRAPEVLYNAAICFEAAREHKKSITVRNRLITGYPQSRLAARALHMLAGSHEALKQTGKAAAAYERFVQHFPGERGAPEALTRALVLRLQRGEIKAAQADLKALKKNYGRRRKFVERIARATFMVGDFLQKKGDHPAVIRHYEVFLKKWARPVAPAWRVLALARLGRAYWLRSCPVKAVNGSCLRPAPRKAARCGLRPRMVRRRKAQVRKAKHYLSRARAFHRGALLRPTKSTNPRIKRLSGAMYLAVTWAAYYEAEVEHEQLLSLSLPRGKRRLEARLQEVDRTMARAHAAYQQVIMKKQGRPALAAVARRAQLYQSLARALCIANHPRAAAEKKKAEEAHKFHAEKARELEPQSRR